MNPEPSASLDHQLQKLKDLYAQLFILMDQSLTEQLDQSSGGVDPSLRQLMQLIEQTHQTFQKRLQRQRAEGELSSQFMRTVRQFEIQLCEGLNLLSDRIRTRTGELASERETVKEQIDMALRKQRGARGYGGGPRRSLSRLIESDA